jgi:hypothetical protein
MIKFNHRTNLLAAALAGTMTIANTLLAQEPVTDNEAAAAELAIKLSNPVAALITGNRQRDCRLSEIDSAGRKSTPFDIT